MTLRPSMPPQPQWPSIPQDRLSVRFFQPAPELRRYISGYNVYGCFGPQAGQRELYFPSWPTIRFNFNQTPWLVRYGRGARDAAGPAVIFGASASDIQSEVSPVGVSVGFALAPLGTWPLLGTSAAGLAGKLTPLAHIWPDALDIHSAIAALPDVDAVPAFFDAMLRARLRPPGRDAAKVAQLTALLIAPHQLDVRAICDTLACSEATLRRLALRHFGFPSKLLLRRSRFMKSLMAIIGQPPGRWSQLIDASYFDQSHFIRDCREFLDASPSEFLSMPRPMTALSMAERAKILGAPVVSLHRSTE